MGVKNTAKGSWHIMRRRKKTACSCAPQSEVCNVCNETPTQTKVVSHCKKPIKKEDECPCGDYEITHVDNCVKLAKQAEELFEKALEFECKATESYEQAKECEKSSKVLSAKAESLLNKANTSEKEAKAAECKAKELMEKAEQLKEQAKCLYKEAECIEKEAQTNCEQAKCLFEKAQSHNEKAKALYNQALKCDEKALECYKTAGEKIKEYEAKSHKCEAMMEKCMNKIDECHNKPKCGEVKHTHCEIEKPKTNCGCKKEYVQPCKQKEEIIYIEDAKINVNQGCSTYVSPMYDMYHMQYMGEFAEQYPYLEAPYMNVHMGQCEDMNEMWMNYYMMMQNMMMQNMMQPRDLD